MEAGRVTVLEALQVSPGAPQFRIGERARGCQLFIEPVDLLLFPTHFPVFGCELLLHLIQPSAQRSDHLIFRRWAWVS